MSNKEKAIQMAQDEMMFAGRYTGIVVDVVPSEHPLACEIHLADGTVEEVSGLIAVRLREVLRG